MGGLIFIVKKGSFRNCRSRPWTGRWIITTGTRWLNWKRRK